MSIMSRLVLGVYLCQAISVFIDRRVLYDSGGKEGREGSNVTQFHQEKLIESNYL